jgi:hypothetical protein
MAQNFHFNNDCPFTYLNYNKRNILNINVEMSLEYYNFD